MIREIQLLLTITLLQLRENFVINKQLFFTKLIAYLFH